MTPVPPYSPPGGGGGQTEAEVQAQIDAAVTGILDGAPGALDTLNELAAALGDDAAFSAHVATAIAGATSDAAAASAAAALVQTHLDDHINDGTAAHTAAAIAIADLHGFGDDLNEVINAGILPQLIAAETDVSNALGQASTAQATADNHIADTTNAHAAAAIGNTPAGNIAATTVQAALNELDSEKATTGSVSTVATGLSDHLADTSDAHDASAISVLDSGNHFTGTDVEAVLAELATAGGGGSIAPDVQVLTGAGTYTKPLNARLGGMTAVLAIGAGGGGGRGGLDAAGTTRTGGGGGGAGGTNLMVVPTARFDATEPYSVGTGGAAGTAMDTGSNLGGKVGNPGSNGGNTTFGKAATVLVQAGGGQGGSGGAGSTSQSFSQAVNGAGTSGIGPAGHGGGGANHNPLLGNGNALPSRAGAGIKASELYPGGDFFGRMAARTGDLGQQLSPNDLTTATYGGGAGGGAATDAANAGGSNSGGGRGGGSISTGNVVRTTGAATATTITGQNREGGAGGAASAVNTVNGTAGGNGIGVGSGGGGGGAATSGGTAVSGNGGAGSNGYLVVITEVE